MSTVNFLNQFGNLITEQQTSLMSSFSKVTLENNEIKLEEFFEAGSLIQATYYADNNENVTPVIAAYPELSLHLNKQVAGNYKIYDVQYYSNGILTGKRKEVHNQDNDIIFDQSIDITTGAVISVRKMAHGNGKLLYEFGYNTDGSVKYIDRYEDADDYGGTYTAAGILTVPGFSWAGLQYYQNAAPMVP
jgi:hypothetical protein